MRISRRGLIVLLLCFTVTFVSATISVGNVSIEKNYPVGQILSGELELNLTNVDVNAMITSNFGHSLLLRDFLDANGVVYSCDPFDCSSAYSIDSTSEEISVDLGIGEREGLGFVLSGDNVDVLAINFTMSSTFDSGSQLPLRITFLEDATTWTYDQFSGSQFRDRYYDCYDPLLSEEGPIVGGVMYCSSLELFESTSYIVGADLFVNNASDDLRMLLYNDLGTELGRCSFNLGLDDIRSCKIDSPSLDPFSRGSYYVCLQAKDGDSGYVLAQSSSPSSYCSFASPARDFNYTAAAKNATRSYGIFAQEALYADSSALGDVLFDDLVSSSNSFTLARYGDDCSEGCIYPFDVFAGVRQNITFSNLVVSYLSDGEQRAEESFVRLDGKSATLDYDGVLDLSSTGFMMNESGTLELFIESEEILSEDIALTSAPLISSVYPSVVPAGIVSTFYADVDYDSDATLSYEWNFGDGSSQITAIPNVTHLYTNISTRTVRLTVRVSNLSNEYEYDINVVSPENYVGVIYDLYSGYFNQTQDDILTFPDWQQKKLEELVDIIGVEDSLRRIRRDINGAIDDSDYLEIAAELLLLDVPARVYVADTSEFDASLVSDFHVAAVSAKTGDSMDSGTLDDYQAAIARWQDAFITYDVTARSVRAIYSTGEVSDLLMSYSMSVVNSAEDVAFLDLDVSRDELFFHTVSRDPREYAGDTIVELPVGSTTLSFFIVGSDPVSFFSAPYFSELILAPEITDNCNFNYICESGEDSRVCRSDCKPVVSLVVWLIVLLILFIVLYSLLVWWYATYYEHKLFPEAYRLENLLHYISSARESGMTRQGISDSLLNKGWSGERVSYVLRKAYGERIGLPELIPFSRIFRHHETSDTSATNNRVVGPLNGKPMPPVPRPGITGVGQQGRRNINKESRRMRRGERR